jgi:hypothetical protein
MSEKNRIPLFCFFFVRKEKSVRIMKKYHVVIFFVKKRREKKVFFCVILFHEDSFRDIV